MAQSKKIKSKSNSAKKNANSDFHFVFDRENYRWLIVGSAIVVFGFILMAGKTDELFVENVFTFNSHLKVTIAPTLVLPGFAVQGYAIMRKPKKRSTDELS